MRLALGRAERRKPSSMKVTGMFRACARAATGPGSSGPQARNSASFSARIRGFQTRSNSRSPTFMGRKRKCLSGKYRSKDSLFHPMIWTANVVTGSGVGAEEILAKSSLCRRVTAIGALVPGKQDCYLHALRWIRQSQALTACHKLWVSEGARSSSSIRSVQVFSTRRRRCSVRSRSHASASPVISKCFE